MSDTSGSSSFFDISGLVFGLLGLAGTIQLFCIIVFYYVPKRRLHGIEIGYAEAYYLYYCGVQEGVLDADMERIEEMLRWTRAEINQIHSEVFCLGNFWMQVLAIFRLAQSFYDLNVDVKELCADIASSSQKGRRNLEASGRCYKACMLPMMGYAVAPSSPAMMQPVLGVKQPHTTYIQSDYQCRGATPHHTHRAEPDVQPIGTSLFSSTNTKRVPIHRDSITSVSTTSTAVDVDSTIRTEASTIQPKLNLEVSNSFLGISDKTSSVHKGMTSRTSVIENRYKDVQCLMESLLSNLHHLSELNPQAEERDISDELSGYESGLSKLHRTWTRSSRPPILPL